MEVAFNGEDWSENLDIISLKYVNGIYRPCVSQAVPKPHLDRSFLAIERGMVLNGPVYV